MRTGIYKLQLHTPIRDPNNIPTMKLILFVLLYAGTTLATEEYIKVTTPGMYNCGKGFERIKSQRECQEAVKQLAVGDPNVRNEYYPGTPLAYRQNSTHDPPYCYLFLFRYCETVRYYGRQILANIIAKTFW